MYCICHGQKNEIVAPLQKLPPNWSEENEEWQDGSELQKDKLRELALNRKMGVKPLT